MRALFSVSLASAIAAAAVAACYVGPVSEPGATSGTSPTDPSGGGDGGGQDGSAVSGDEGGVTNPASGLPCDVDALLASRCRSCHAPGRPAPMSLVTYEDLAKPSLSAPGKSTAVVALERMQDDARPMPPSGPRATATEIGALQAWIEAGLPRGTCGATTGDGGVVADAAPEAGPAPLPGAGMPPVCTSGMTWTSTQRGPQMQPGRACITCHEAQEDDPVVWVGGTVYPTLHEPDGCYGAGAAGAVVVVTDAAGRVVTMPVGPTGNFSLNARTSAPLAMPIRAKVVANGVERAMFTPQNSGNCNGCHTQNGANGAPGRIVLP